MATSVSKICNDYIEWVNRELNVTLPEAKRKLEATKRKLERHLFEIPRQRENSKLELEYLQTRDRYKTLCDIPVVAWREISKHFYHPLSDFLKLCMASPSLDQMITERMSVRKLSLTGEMVFSLLVRNSYVTETNLKTCARVNEEFGMFAGKSWRFLPNAAFSKIILYTREDVLIFLEELAMRLKGGELMCEFFMGKTLKFIYKSNEVFAFRLTKCQLGYWKHAYTLFQIYGKYLFSIEVWDGDETDHALFSVFHAIYKNLLPNLQCFEAWGSVTITQNRLLREPDWKTMNTFYSISLNISRRKNDVFLQLASPLPENWRALTWDTCQSPVNFLNLKRFYLFVGSSTHAYESFLSVCQVNIDGIEELQLHPCGNFGSSLEFASRFPNLTRLYICSEASESNPEHFVFPYKLFLPGVQSLTLNFNLGGYLPLHKLAAVFPSLKRLCLLSKLTKNAFTDILRDMNFKGEFNDHVVDLYHLYSNNHSLVHSNIWRELPSLRILLVETISPASTNEGVEEQQRRDVPCARLRVTERYVRNSSECTIKICQI